MVRFVQEMKIVEREGLIPAAARKGELLADGLRALSCRFPELVRNVRGMGLYQGFSLPTPEVRARLIQTALQQENLLLLGAGCRSIRTRPNLSVTEEEIGLFLEKLERCLTALAG